MLLAVRTYIEKHGLMCPGERVGVAVSGGADSVALLLALHALQKDLGIVISVVHYNHKIRGTEADEDERFVTELAKTHGFELDASGGDVPAAAKENRESLETAARSLRYQFFEQLLDSGKVDKIALAHTRDDQAETVLMRFLRGAGSKGLAGIYPSILLGKGRIVRPFLETSRAEIERYLKERTQAWREDPSNRDTVHTRNKVRQELLPKLREFNPSVVEALAKSADVFRAEEEYWQSEAGRLLPLVLLPGKATRGGGRAVSAREESAGVDLDTLRRYPLALQRRILRSAAESFGLALDVGHFESILAVADGRSKAYELPAGWRVERSHRELRFERAGSAGTLCEAAYEFPIPIPGKVPVPQLNLLVQAHLKPDADGTPAYNREAFSQVCGSQVFFAEAGRLVPLAAAGDLRLRNWREGDRFRPAHSRTEKKVKDLLHDLKVPKERRRGWPVVASQEKVIWVQGTRPWPLWFADDKGLQRLIIEAADSESQ